MLTEILFALRLQAFAHCCFLRSRWLAVVLVEEPMQLLAVGTAIDGILRTATQVFEPSDGELWGIVKAIDSALDRSAQCRDISQAC